MRASSTCTCTHMPAPALRSCIPEGSSVREDALQHVAQSRIFQVMALQKTVHRHCMGSLRGECRILRLSANGNCAAKRFRWGIMLSTSWHIPRGVEKGPAISRYSFASQSTTKCCLVIYASLCITLSLCPSQHALFV